MIPDSKVHVANMGTIWGRQDPGGPHVGHMNLAIRDISPMGTRYAGSVVSAKPDQSFIIVMVFCMHYRVVYGRDISRLYIFIYRFPNTWWFKQWLRRYDILKCFVGTKMAKRTINRSHEFSVVIYDDKTSVAFRHLNDIENPSICFGKNIISCPTISTFLIWIVLRTNYQKSPNFMLRHKAPINATVWIVILWWYVKYLFHVI